MIDRNSEIQDPEELQRTIFETLQAGLWTTLPCIVDTVNFTAQTITAISAIKAKVTDKDGNVEDIELPPLVDIPICFPRAGGFALTFPIAVGDECLVIFASRCIDAWWQSGGVQTQAELRMHDLSDGFCLLAPTSQPNVLANVSAVNAQLRTEAGTSFVELTPDGRINMTALLSINLVAPIITKNASVAINSVAPTNNLIGDTVNVEAAVALGLNATAAGLINLGNAGAGVMTMYGSWYHTGIIFQNTITAVNAVVHKHLAGTPPGDTGTPK